MFLSELRESFAAYAPRLAVEFPGRRYRFDQLEQAAERTAALLQARGVTPGDRVILFLRAKEPFLLAHLGALWAGAVPLPLNPDFRPAELEYFARDSQARLLAIDRTTSATARAVLARCPSLTEQVDAEAILSATAPQPYRPVSPCADDPALMLYSSGTTGEPKGVVHTQANLACAVRAICACWRITADDVLANVLPLFHIHGLSFATHASLLAGSSMLMGDRFHPVETLDLIDRATIFMGVPPYYYAFLKREEFRQRAARWKRLRLVTCGSAPIRPEVLPELESMLGRPVLNRYGMTECHVLTSLPLEGPWPHGSVGRPLSGIEVQVRHAAGRPCGPSEVGAVLARGPNLFRNYWRRPEATAASFTPDGWFSTGDLGQLDQQGFLTLVGRSKELIIVGGFNVYPAVVEQVLAECPGVREAAVVGVPSVERGESVAAFVVPDDPALDPRTIRQFCRERLADYQCPTILQIVSALPRNTMGKVLKRELREHGPTASGYSPADLRTGSDRKSRGDLC